MTPAPQALVRTRPDETPPSNQPATSNLGRFFELVTQACDLGSRTDPKSTNHTRLPVDQMFAEGALEVLRGIAQENEAMGIATVDQVRSHLPRLNFFLEAGIELAGGPEEAARDFLGRAHPQIERRAFVLSSKSRTVSTKDLWGEAVAGFLRSLVDSVRVRATEVLEAAKRLERENRGVIGGNRITVNGYNHLSDLLGWGQEPNKILIAYLMDGRRILGLEGLRLSVAKKLAAPYRHVSLPDEVSGRIRIDSKNTREAIRRRIPDYNEEMERETVHQDLPILLSTYLANFILGTEQFYISADQMRVVQRVCADWDGAGGMLADFKRHLKRRFDLTDEEMKAIEADIDAVPNSVNDSVFNATLYRPFENAEINTLCERLMKLGANRDHAYGMARYFHDPDEVRTGEDADYYRKYLSQMTHLPLIIQCLIIERFIEPERQEAMYMEIALSSHELDALSLAFLKEKIDLGHAELQNSPKLLAARSDLAPQKHVESLLDLILDRQVDPPSEIDLPTEKTDTYQLGVDWLNIDGTDVRLLKKALAIVDRIPDEEVEDFIARGRQLWVAMIIRTDAPGVIRRDFDLSPLRDRVPALWEKLNLAKHLNNRDYDYSRGVGWRTSVFDDEGEYDVLLPWEQMMDERLDEDHLDSDHLFLSHFEGGRERIAALMAQYSERDIFYWFHGDGENADALWADYEQRREAFFIAVKALEEKSKK